MRAVRGSQVGNEGTWCHHPSHPRGNDVRNEQYPYLADALLALTASKRYMLRAFLSFLFRGLSSCHTNDLNTSVEKMLLTSAETGIE
jgi:hypothetical protein